MSGRLIIAILAQLAGIASLLMWGFTAMFAPMLFAGEANARTWTVFALFVAMPVLVIAASIALWVGFAKRWTTVMTVSALFITLSCLPLLAAGAA